MINQHLWSLSIAFPKLEHHEINHVRLEILQSLRCRNLKHRPTINRNTISGIACFRVPDKPEMQRSSVRNSNVIDPIHITSFFPGKDSDIIKAVENKLYEFTPKEAELEIGVSTNEVLKVHLEIGSKTSAAFK